MDKQHFAQLAKGVREMKLHIGNKSVSTTRIAAKRKRLVAAGWKTGSAKDFLQLNDEEAALVKRKITKTTVTKRKRA